MFDELSFRGLDSEARVESCLEGCEVCLEAAHHFVEDGRGREETECVRLLLDCAQICKTTADFMVCGSNHKRVSEVCAQLCLEAARHWDRQARSMNDMSAAYLRACVGAVRRCADHCRDAARSTREPLQHALIRAGYH